LSVVEDSKDAMKDCILQATQPVTSDVQTAAFGSNRIITI